MSRQRPYAPPANPDDAAEASNQFDDLPYDAELNFNDQPRFNPNPFDESDLTNTSVDDGLDDDDLIDHDDLYDEDY